MRRGLSLPITASLLVPATWAAPMLFTDVTRDVGIFHSHGFVPSDQAKEPARMSGGAVAEDFDGDGLLDLFVLQGNTSAALLYMNSDDGVFAEEAETRGADLRGQGMGAAAADFDNDGDVDICVTHRQPPHALLINDGTGHFAVDTQTLTLPGEPLYRSSVTTSPSWGDVDNDGLLELAFGHWGPAPRQGLWLYRNRGGGVLEEAEFREVPAEDPFLFSPRFADIDGDRLSDLLLTSDFGNSRLYRNLGDGLFRDVTESARIGTDENGMGSAVGDFDGDGDLDWFIASIFDPGAPEGNWGVTGNRLYRNRGSGVFDDVTTAAGVRDGAWGWGSSFGDLDLDGDLDLFHVNGWFESLESIMAKFNDQPARLFENLGGGRFADVAEAVGAGNRGQGRGVVMFDFDGDGDLDIFIANNRDVVPQGDGWIFEPGTPALLRNDIDTANHWLVVTLEGVPPLHRHGIGSRVLVTAEGRTQMRELHASTNFLSQNPGRLAHFGLGSAEVAEEVRAEWVDGDATLLFDVAADQSVAVPSCRALVTPRAVLPGEAVHASAASVEPITAPRQWVVEGEVLDDPVTLTFDTEGLRDLRLDLFEPDGVTPLRSEIHRVSVRRDPPVGVLSH